MRNPIDESSIRRKVQVREDGSTLLIEDFVGFSVTAEDAVETHVEDISDAEWKRAKERMSTHELTFNPQARRFTSKPRQKDEK